MAENNNSLYIAALQGVPGIGALTLRRLLQAFESGKAIWHASPEALKASGYLKSNTIQALTTYRKNTSLSSFEKQLKKYDIQYVTIEDESYPFYLRHIYNPPAVLFYKGKYSVPERLVAIVGARRATTYGRDVARAFGEALSRAGIGVVSGGARGIDSFAHEGALKGTTPTISVMGCGLDVVYPPENRKLFQEIEEKGMCISEYVPGTAPIGTNFPARNRIISGLCRAVIVVEAKAASGSLITADMALSEGRDVYAIPGSIYSKYSEGAHWLIKQGAITLFSPEDLLGEYGWLPQLEKFNKVVTNGESVLSFTIEENLVLNAFSSEGTHSMDELQVQTGFPFEKLNMILLKLELNRCIEQTQTGVYRLVPGRESFVH